MAKIAPPAALPVLLTLVATVALAGPVGPWYVSNNIDTSGSAFLSQLESINWGINLNTSPESIAVVNVGGSFFDPPATVDTTSAIDPFCGNLLGGSDLGPAACSGVPAPSPQATATTVNCPGAPQDVHKQP